MRGTDENTGERTDERAGSTEPGADFGALVLELVLTIPPGKAMSYGGIAAALGSRAPRRVGAVMATSGGTLDGRPVPWWRVVRADGSPPRGHEAAAIEHYRAEGTPMKSGTGAVRVDLRLARHRT